jgi:hypothetical protein
MLVLPSCYLNVLNMINSTPFPFFQNPSRIVELQDLQCNHGFVDNEQPSASVEFRWDWGFLSSLLQCLLRSMWPSTYSVVALLLLLPGECFPWYIYQRERELH